MPVIENGRTCWRTATAGRASVLIDAAAYYSALREAARTAEHSLFILGWDVDTRTMLVPDEDPADAYPPQLLHFLEVLLNERPALHVYVLAWDFSMIYALERELLPAHKFSRAHHRLHFALDGRHPLGASHHQKVVVVDDRLAFCGGIDLTIRRWDTPEHRADDPGRRDPGGEPYDPMHDVAILVDGDVAAALGGLARERWQRATGQELAPPKTTVTAPKPRRFWNRGAPPHATNNLWPVAAPISFRVIEVAIARTRSALDTGESAVCEIANLTLAAIASAQRCIFIENQYLTSAMAADALAQRLTESDGPEIVVILPEAESGWLEQSSMGVLRARVLDRLRRADVHGRFHVYRPVVPDLCSGCVNVHSKVLIIDDSLLKIGSSNLSNRSMGLDTECDLVIEAAADEQENGPVRTAIAHVRARLLGEHLALAPDEVASLVREAGSLARVIEARRGTPRCLEALRVEAAEGTTDLSGLEELVADPERPIAAELFIQGILPTELSRPVHRSIFALLSMVAPLISIVALARYTNLTDLATVDHVAASVRTLDGHPLSLLYVVVGYVFATLLFCPITVLIAGTTLAFPPLKAVGLAMLGAVSAASASYFVGRLLGRAPLRYLSIGRLAKVRAILRRRAFRATMAARLLPLGNFTAINLLAGALKVPFRAYLLGNVAGLVPGVLGISVFAGQLESTFYTPSFQNLALLGLSLLALLIVMSVLGRLIGMPRREERAPAPKVSPGAGE